MPRRRSQSQKRGLILGALGVLVGFLILGGLSYLSGRGDVDLSNLADRDFYVGDTERLAAEIRDGGPFLVADASPNQARDVYITHGGGDLDENWRAIAAGERGCTLVWQEREFRDPCTGETYGAGGEGLTRYKTRVEDGSLYVDLRSVVEE